MPVIGHWFHNKEKGRLEMYKNLLQPPVCTKKVIFFNKRAEVTASGVCDNECNKNRV